MDSEAKPWSAIGGWLLHHSDRGCHLLGLSTRLEDAGYRMFDGRTGNCYDNAAMEQFFWSLKHEWTNHEQYQDREDARLSVFKYIETFYNPVRLHQALTRLAPLLVSCYRSTRALKLLFREREGATAVEYALLISFTLLVCIGGIRTLGNAVSGVFEQPLSSDSAKAGVAPAARAAVSPGTPRMNSRRP